MKIKLIILAMLIVCCFSFIGCSKSNTNTSNNDFEVISTQNISSVDTLMIVRHKRTNKTFIIYNGYHKGGIAELNN